MSIILDQSNVGEVFVSLYNNFTPVDLEEQGIEHTLRSERNESSYFIIKILVSEFPFHINSSISITVMNDTNKTSNNLTNPSLTHNEHVSFVLIRS